MLPMKFLENFYIPSQVVLFYYLFDGVTVIIMLNRFILFISQYVR